ncbi:MAG: putative bifunctional diguanylate cyclase/phosphodiesterase, partial [Nocardioidaceae bacterium]
VREVDTVARLGGDEFAVLLEDVDDLSHITGTCERILEALRRRFEIGGEEVSVTTTIGVAISASRDSAETLLSHADLAMYHAKGQGKNRFETYRLSFGDERLQRIALIEALRKAIDAKDLQVAYQPVVDLRSRIAYGVEALVRWRRDGVLVPPDLFIPAAEESGLIVGLGSLVLELVAADTPALRAAAGRNISISVNISAQQLHEPDFTSQVEAARATMGDVELVLELTERDFVANDQQTVTAMTELAASGIRFAIDDFGVGFSSIGYLQRLPVNVLKVDRSFLRHIEDDERACSLVRSMVVMGQALGLDVVIEGVERLTQLDHIVSHADGTIGQGYLFARPMPFEEMESLLVEQRRTSPPRLTAIS